MIQINLVSRIDDDKNSFLDLVFVAYKLKQQGISDFNIQFIGAVNKMSIYQNIIRMADLLEVSDKISFTKKSIMLSELPINVKNGYFLNYSVGTFIGYSGIECINMGFKTIFLNCDKTFSSNDTNLINICSDLNAVIDLIKLISENKLSIDSQILRNNLMIKKRYFLGESDTNLLLKLLLPPD